MCAISGQGGWRCKMEFTNGHWRDYVTVNSIHRTESRKRGVPMRNSIVASGFAAALLLSSPAAAAVEVGNVTGGTSAGIFELKVPTADKKITIGQDNQQSPNLFAMNEKQNVALLRNIAGIRAGTIVSSHYVWFDPRGNSTVVGSVSFAHRILSVLTTRNQLSSTDYLGNPNAIYLNPSARGLENNDAVSFSGNTLNVSFLRASSPGDYVRVLTAVPEPSTWMMLILGFGFVGTALRAEKARQRRQAMLAFG